MNFPCCKSWLLPPALLLCLFEKSLAPPCLHPPSRQWQTPLCLLFSGVNKPTSFSCSSQLPGTTSWGDTHSYTPVLFITDLSAFPTWKFQFNSNTCRRNGIEDFAWRLVLPCLAVAHPPLKQLQPLRCRLAVGTLNHMLQRAFSATCRKNFFFTHHSDIGFRHEDVQNYMFSFVVSKKLRCPGTKWRSHTQELAE